MKSTEEKNQEVTAEVTFLSATGQDPLNKQITSSNVMEFLPDDASVAAVRDYFEKQGIAFRYDQGISATITAERALFEKLFGVGLQRDKNHYMVKGQDNGLDIPLTNLPEAVKERLSNISLPDRMELF
ncbi:hypothetical protein [Pricia sp.]|uniref:hypothetical protein n=1 Tax=Pricia sp. TaxID=2268138 RepID=UPI00359340A5